MAAAYRFAEGSGPIPEPLALLRYIDRFGAQAVTGRPYLGGYEMRRMVIAENVVQAYRSREAAKGNEGGWAKWAEDHPHEHALLTEAARLAEVEDG